MTNNGKNRDFENNKKKVKNKMFGRNKKNILILVKKIGKRYTEIDRVKYKDNDELVSNKKHTIPVPPNNPYTFSAKKNNFLFFDVGTKEYVNFEVTELGLNTEFLGSFWRENGSTTG